MKIAFTADVHLNPDYPERTAALKNVLKQVSAEGIDRLVIAGDLFDLFHRVNDPDSLREFERISSEHPEVEIIIIPGNHDPNIRQSDFAKQNITIFSEPTIQGFGGTKILFLPYANSTMVEQMSEKASELQGQPWILVSHGNYLGGAYQADPDKEEKEADGFMPLTRQDVIRCGVKQVILGHIHIPTPLDGPFHNRVRYVGSPHGLDISETGKRRFLIMDTESRTFEEREISTKEIYKKEVFFIYPSDDELGLLGDSISYRIEGWGFTDAELARVRVRVGAYGYSRNRQAIEQTLVTGFLNKGVQFYKGEAPKLDRLNGASSSGGDDLEGDAAVSGPEGPVSGDPKRDALAKQALEQLKNLDYASGGDEPGHEDVRMVIMETIYGN